MLLLEVEHAMLAHTDTETYTAWNGTAHESYTREWDWSIWMYEADSDEHAVADLGIVRVIETKGGREGDGDRMSLVFSVTDCGAVRYYRKTGYHSSWDADDWDDGELTEVYPVVREVTFYE